MFWQTLANLFARKKYPVQSRRSPRATLSVEPLESRELLSVDLAGNSLTAARNIGALSSSQTFRDFVGSADPVDYYRFNVNNRSVFNLRMDGLSADADVYLLNGSGSVLAGSTKSGTSAETLGRILETGTYYVRVLTYGKANTDYNLTVSASQLYQTSIAFTVAGMYQVTVSAARGTGPVIDPTRTTWLVIHGRNGSPDDGNIAGLSSAIVHNRPGDQVLTLDWRTAAASRFFGGEGYIQPIAQQAAAELTQYGFVGSRLNVVGHSWGALMADELAQRIAGGVHSIVALDPAQDAPVIAGGSAYNPDLPGQIDFHRDAAFSWAFYSRDGHLGIPGSEISSLTAHESFVVTGTDHSPIVDVFANMVGTTRNTVSQQFTLDRLVGHWAGPWSPNRYLNDGSRGDYGAWYEAVIATDGQRAQTVRYVDSHSYREVELKV